MWLLRYYYAVMQLHNIFIMCIIHFLRVARVFWLVVKHCPVAVQLLRCSRWLSRCCYCVLGFVKILCYYAVANYIKILRIFVWLLGNF